MCMAEFLLGHVLIAADDLLARVLGRGPISPNSYCQAVTFQKEADDWIELKWLRSVGNKQNQG